MFSIATIFAVLTDVIDFVEGFFGALKAETPPVLTVQHVAQAIGTALTTTQTAVNLTENQVQLNATQLGAINTALAAAGLATTVTVNTPVQSNLTLALKALTDVVAMIPAGSLHDKIAAVVGAASMVNAAFAQQTASAPVPVSVPTAGAAGSAA
jgi:hypothetical protein